MATKTKKRKSSRPACNHMMDMHKVELPTIAVLSLITAATHAVRHGLSEDDGAEYLEGAVNFLLDRCHITCEFDKSGAMTLTYDADAYRKARRVRGS